MAAENLEPIAFVARPAESQPAPLVDAPLATAVSAPTPEELHAIASVFAERDRQSAGAAGLLGAWSAGMVLHEVLKDTLTEPAGEVEAEKKKKPKDSASE
jgi:hypothetical protein